MIVFSPSLSLALEIFSLHCKAHKTHALLLLSSWREKKKPKRSRSKRKSTNCWVWSSTCVLKVPLFCMRCTSSRERRILFPRKSFHRDTSVFSLVSSYARWHWPFSLFNARIHRRSTRTKRSFCENWSGTFICLCVLLSKTANEREKRKFRWRDGSSFVSRSAADWIVSLLTMIAKKTNA